MKSIQWPELASRDLLVTNAVAHSGVRNRDCVAFGGTAPRAGNSLVYMFQGRIEVTQRDFGELTADAGTLLYLPQGLVYNSYYRGAHNRFSMLSFRLLGEAGEPVVLGNKAALLADGAPSELAAAFLRVEQISQNGAMPAPLMVKELLYHIFHLITRAFDHQRLLGSRRYAKLIPGVRLLEASFRVAMPVRAYAKASHVSESCFRQLFSELYGMPPTEYRNLLRIRYAEYLLESAPLTVAAVAEECGFSNPSYFYRLYRQIAGHSPKGKTDTSPEP